MRDLVSLKAADFAYGKAARLLIHQLDFTVVEGQIVVILGESGVGKTSLLKVLAGLAPLRGGRRQCSSDYSDAFAFQTAVLVPWLTVGENLVFPKALRPFLEDELEILRALKVAQFLDLYPDQLSGGMRARVHFASALLKRPRVLFVDEVLSSLDLGRRVDLIRCILSVRGRFYGAIVMSTHLIREALVCADTLYVLTRAETGAVAMRGFPTFPKEGRELSELLVGDAALDDAASKLSRLLLEEHHEN